MLSKVVQEIIKRGVTAARKKFGDEKVKKAHDKMQEEGFDFQDMVKGRGVFKDFTVKDIAKLDKYSAQQRRKVMKQKTREYKVGQAKKKFDKTVKNLENIPLSHVAGAGAAAEGTRRVMKKAGGGEVIRKPSKCLNGIAIRGKTRAPHRPRSKHR